MVKWQFGVLAIYRFDCDKNFIIMSLLPSKYRKISCNIKYWCILLQEYKDVSTINNSNEKSLLVTNMSWNDIKVNS